MRLNFKKLLKTMCISFVMSMLLAIMPINNHEIHAATQIGNSSVYWEISNKVLTISGSGAIPGPTNYYDYPWYYNNFDTIVIGDDITSIPSGAFIWRNSGTVIKKITIGKNVSTIAQNSFAYDKITTLEFKGTVQGGTTTKGGGINANAFKANNSSNVTNLILPSGWDLGESGQVSKWGLKFNYTHAHTWSYATSGSALTATCSSGHSTTITISASDSTYNGSVYTGASRSAWSTNYGLGTPDIEYEGVSPTSYTKSTTAPTNVGSYTASITVGDKTVSANFTIAKGNINPTVSMESWTRGDTAKDPSVTGNTGNGTVSYKYKVQGAEDSTYSDVKPSSAGNYTVKASIAATTNYNAGSATANFTIYKASITPNVSLTGWIYGQTPNSPSVTGNTGNGEVTYYYKNQGADDSTYSTNTPVNVGSYTIKASIAESDEYSDGFATANFAISKADITPTVSLSNWVYGSNGNNPTVSGNSGNGNVSYEYKVQGEADTTYSSTKPSNVGNYTVRANVTATTNYNAGSATCNFSITPRIVTIGWEDLSFEYDGAEKIPTAFVENKVGNDVVGVTVTGEQIEAGEHTATIANALTGADKDNYQLPSTLPTQTFTIEPKSIDDEGITITALCGDTNTPSYTGQALTPTITVKDTDIIGVDSQAKTLTSADYEIVAAQSTTSATLPGEYTITIQGKGNYTGTTTVTWKILPLTYNQDHIVIEPCYTTYDGDSHQVTVTEIPEGSTISFIDPVSENPLSENPSFTEVGNHTVKYKIHGVTGYEDKELYSVVAIEQKPVELVWSNLSLEYNGTEQLPTVVINQDSIVGNEQVSIGTVIGGQTNVGTHEAEVTTLTGTDAGNYTVAAHHATKEYEIYKRKIAVPVPVKTDFTYNREEQTYTFSNLHSAYTVENNTGTNAGEKTVTAHLTDTANNEWYDPNTTLTNVEKENDKYYTFKIEPWDISDIAKVSINPDSTYFVYDGTEKTINVTVNDGKGATDLILGVVGNDNDYTLTINSATAIGKHPLTINFHNNYTGTIIIPWEIVEHADNPKNINLEDIIEEPTTGKDNEVKVVIIGDEERPDIDFENPIDILTPEDIELLNKVDPGHGSTKVVIEFIISVNIDNTIHEDSLAAIESVIGSPVNPHYYDISLIKVIKYYDGSTVVHTEVVPINELDENVELTIHLPEDILPVKNGYTRKYIVVRSHNYGTIELPEFEAKSLDVEYIKPSEVYSNGAVTFGSNKFSDFLLTYKDTLIPRSYKAPDTSVR